MPSTMTLVDKRMSSSQQQQPGESCRVRYVAGPKHSKASQVVTFNTHKSYVSTTSKDSSDDEEEEYFRHGIKGKSATGRESESVQNFDIIKTLHEGKFSKIFLAKLEKQRMVLKSIEYQNATSLHMYYRELDFNYWLSPHENVNTSYNVVLRWQNYYIFAQEYAPAGDLGKYLKKFGALSELKTKAVAKQLASALDFIHGLNLVHQAVLPENILVFTRECTLIKLTDFCAMRPTGTLVVKGNLENLNSGSFEMDNDDEVSSTVLAYTPPEICTKLSQEKYHVHPSIDVWAVGIIIWACLSGTGQGPWQAAFPLRDPCFRQFYEWAKKKSLKVPDAFQPLSYRLLRLIKRLLEPKPEKRCKAREVLKYLKDDWLANSSSSKNTAAVLSRLGMSRSESCTFGNGSSGTVNTTGGFGRASSQRYARRGSVCPRSKSDLRKTKRQQQQESNNNGGRNGNPNIGSSSPRQQSKLQQQQSMSDGNYKSGAGGETSGSFRMSCVLETHRVVPLSTIKSATTIVPVPPSPTPPSTSDHGNNQQQHRLVATPSSSAQKCP